MALIGEYFAPFSYLPSKIDTLSNAIILKGNICKHLKYLKSGGVLFPICACDHTYGLFGTIRRHFFSICKLR
jgi:hypothetical protein